MWWMLLSMSILLVLIYVLFAPFFIEVNSILGLYRIRFHRLGNVDVAFKASTVFMEVNILGWHKEFDMLRKKPKKVKPHTKKEKVKRKVDLKKITIKGRNIVRSFSVEKCYVTLDTGSMPSNGIMYPWFYLLSRQTGKNITINFWGENTIILQLKNSLARMLWAFMKST